MIAPIRRLLFATDLSPKMAAMFRFAAQVAAQHCAGMTILHVLQEAIRKEAVTMMIANLLGEERWRQLQEQDAQKARSILVGKQSEAREIRSIAGSFCDYVRDRHPSVTVGEDDVLAIQGPVAETIVRTAEEARCDLIVMGYHRHGGFADAMAGDIVKAVMRRSRVPILLIPPPDDPA